MVEPDAFEVGIDLAVTPGAVVLRTDVFELIQYTPQTTKVRAVPLLIVPPTINKYYVIDLAEQRSLVEHLVAGGQQVYCISWRNPDARHADWGLDTYGQAIIEAMDAGQKISRQDQVALLGICSGGMLASMVLAPPRRHRRARPGGGVQPRGHGARPGPGRAAQRAALAQGGGRLDQGVEGEGLPRRPDAGRGVRLAAAQRPDLELLGQQLPARPRAQGLRHPLLERRPGADDRRDAPRLHGPRDHQRPHRARAPRRCSAATSTSARSTSTPTSWPASPTTCASGSPATRPPSCSAARPKFVLSTSGHIAAMVNPPGNPKASFQTAPSNPADAAGVARPATKVKGSWWDDYVDWLAERTGPERNKPTPARVRGVRADLRRPRHLCPSTAEPAHRLRATGPHGRVRGIPARVSVRPARGRLVDEPPLLLCNGIGASLEALQPLVDALDPDRGRGAVRRARRRRQRRCRRSPTRSPRCRRGSPR